MCVRVWDGMYICMKFERVKNMYIHMYIHTCKSRRVVTTAIPILGIINLSNQGSRCFPSCRTMSENDEER